ncbi:hypothetical protein J4209_00210 [Candidatus Woesearchaeota archaeon]|nr:hypothetical protein [Candidatus Woesearchaeota archaeon]
MASKIRKALNKELKNLKDYIVLVVVDSKNYQNANIEILKDLVDAKNTPGVYVTLNKPYDIIRRILEKERIDTRMMIFIDCISSVAGGKLKKIENCLYIGSPEKLSDISVAIDQAVNALPKGDKFIFLDSLSTLLIYNKEGTVARFFHFIVGKIRALKVKGVIISIEKESDKALINELSTFCDARLDF